MGGLHHQPLGIPGNGRTPVLQACLSQFTQGLKSEHEIKLAC